MANVLIGIIGVILFIGLAMATVTYVGSQFAVSYANSSAASATQGTAQVAEAVNLAYTQTGSMPTVTTDVTSQLVTANFLRGVPVNEVVHANAPMLMTLAGSVTSGSAQVAVMDIGQNDLVCLRVGVQTGQISSSATSPATGTAFPTSPSSGCIKMTTGATGGLTVGDDYVYALI